MKAYSVIPERMETVNLISGADFSVDTKGSDCIIKVTGGNITLSVSGKSGQTFPLNDGESLSFCGKLIYRHNGGSPIVHLLYYHTL